MNEISCGLCMDLIPVVRDGIGSEDAREAVERHIQTCAACRSLYDSPAPPPPNPERAMGRIRQQLQAFSAVLLVFGAVFGVGLTSGEGMFYNSLIMPFVGALGYVLFRWKSLAAIPALLLITHGVVNLVNWLRGAECLNLPALLSMTGIYALLAGGGVLAAGLLHCAFRKEG